MPVTERHAPTTRRLARNDDVETACAERNIVLATTGVRLLLH